MPDETKPDPQDAPAQEPQRELTDAELTGVEGAGILRPPSYDTPLDDGSSSGWTRIL